MTREDDAVAAGAGTAPGARAAGESPTGDAAPEATEPVVGVAPGKPAEVVAVRPVPPARPPTAASAWRRRLVLAAGPLALAAAMVIYVGGQSGPTAPELPAYTLTAGPPGSSDPTTSPRLRVPKTGGRHVPFELSLRPATAPQEKIVAYAFTIDPSTPEPAPLEAKVEIGPDGSVKLAGSARALEGATEIRIIIGAPTSIGKFVDAATRARSAKSDAHVLVMTVPIDRE